MVDSKIFASGQKVMIVPVSLVFSPFANAFAALADDEAFKRAVRESVEENLSLIRLILIERKSLESVNPDRPAALASLQARLDVTEGELNRGYRAGIRMLLRETTSALIAEAERRRIGAVELAAEIQVYVDRVLLISDSVIREVSAVHAREQEMLRESRRQFRQRLTREILAGDGPMNEADLAMTLHYAIGEHHVAVILTDTPQADLAPLAVGLADRAVASSWIGLPVGGDSIGIWFSHAEEWSEQRLTRLREGLAGLGRVASIGDPGEGLAGFRRTLNDAQRTETLRRSVVIRLPEVLSYREVQLDILLRSDEDGGRFFVDAELGALAEDTAENARLRATLAARLATGSNVSAAAVLGLHEHTVRNHLRRAEELLGDAFRDRRLELHAALRILELRESESTTAPTP